MIAGWNGLIWGRNEEAESKTNSSIEIQGESFLINVRDIEIDFKALIEYWPIYMALLHCYPWRLHQTHFPTWGLSHLQDVQVGFVVLVFQGFDSRPHGTEPDHVEAQIRDLLLTIPIQKFGIVPRITWRSSIHCFCFLILKQCDNFQVQQMALLGFSYHLMP